jgi:DNA adenine methylase
LSNQPTLPTMQFRSPLKPFLRWAGGKSRITKLLANYVPENYDRYWEPFLGSGALYFFLCPAKAYLSDSNSALVDCYKHVKKFPEKISKKLQEYGKKTSEDYYYEVRDLYNNSRPSVEQSARFIYLNKSNFNGIFRVNEKGEYNVPYGHKKSLAIPSLDEFKEISKLLKSATIKNHTFEQIKNNKTLKSNDFIYLDPPYPPLTPTSYFTHYTAERFSWEDQEKAADLANVLSSKGCFIMISNSDVSKIRTLYKDWNLFKLPVVRWVAANGKRHKVNELVITNYEPRIGGERHGIF